LTGTVTALQTIRSRTTLPSSKIKTLQKKRETQMILKMGLVMNSLSTSTGLVSSIAKAETVTCNTQRHRQLQTTPTAKVTAPFLII